MSAYIVSADGQYKISFESRRVSIVKQLVINYK
ncbi:hypothetical protein BH09BAC4_BH09BAC4_05250 [soil metagenome]